MQRKNPIQDDMSVEKTSAATGSKPRMGFHIMNLPWRLVDVFRIDSMDMNALTGKVQTRNVETRDIASLHAFSRSAKTPLSRICNSARNISGFAIRKSIPESKYDSPDHLNGDNLVKQSRRRQLQIASCSERHYKCRSTGRKQSEPGFT